MGVFEAYLMNNILCSLQISLSGSPEPLNEKIMGLDNLILRNLQSNESYCLQMMVEDTCLPDILTQRTESVSVELRSGNVSAVILGVNRGKVKPMILEASNEEEVVDKNCLALPQLLLCPVEVKVDVECFDEGGDGIFVGVGLLLDNLHQVLHEVSPRALVDDDSS